MAAKKKRREDGVTSGMENRIKIALASVARAQGELARAMEHLTALLANSQDTPEAPANVVPIRPPQIVPEESETDALIRITEAMERIFQELGQTAVQFENWYRDKCQGKTVAHHQAMLAKLQNRVMVLRDVEVTGPMADSFESAS